jgi:aspartate/methionine/tyrosine aminotransferase
MQELKQFQAKEHSLVSLMRGQPDTATPAHIVEAVRKAIHDGRTGYADNQGELALRRAVADKLRREQGLSYNPDREILITDGATLGVYAALGALVDHNRTVLLPDPIYDAYEGPITLWGSRVIPVGAVLRDGRFRMSSHQLENSRVSRNDVILLNTPWNPVGTVLAQDELVDIMEFAAKYNCLVISDEIYESFIYDDRRHVSPASISADARQRTVVVNSLSKTYAMTGWRIGYCAGPEEIIRAMLLILQQSSRGPATFVQDAAVCALNSDQDCVVRMTREYQSRRDRVIDQLCSVSGVKVLVPEGGLFVMVDVTGLGRSSDTVRRRLLEEAGVVVLHGAAYGVRGEGFLRISFAAGGETLDHGLERLRDGLLRLVADSPASTVVGGSVGL